MIPTFIKGNKKRFQFYWHDGEVVDTQLSIFILFIIYFL